MQLTFRIQIQKCLKGWADARRNALEITWIDQRLVKTSASARSAMRRVIRTRIVYALSYGGRTDGAGPSEAAPNPATHATGRRGRRPNNDVKLCSMLNYVILNYVRCLMLNYVILRTNMS